MTQNEFQDIIPPNRRTIRNVNNSHTEHAKHPTPPSPPPSQPEHDNQEETMDIPTPPSDRNPKSSKLGLLSIGGVVIVILALSFSLLLADSKVTVIPKQKNILVDAKFQALKGTAGDGVSYEVMSIEKVASRTVPATGQEEIEEKASGTIVIYNDFNSRSQRLVKNTRFETSEGFIYRIDKSVVVPGQKTENGEITPGSVEVIVYADETGEKYNVGLTDFTIPGFKGDSRYEDFYARSKSAMTGGFVGMRPTVDSETLEMAKEEIRGELKEMLITEAMAQKPEGFYLFEDAAFFEFESMPYGESDSNAEVKEKGILYGVLFDKLEFADFLAENTIAGFDNEPVIIGDMTALSFIIEDKENTHPWIEEEFFFTLSGNTRIIWLFDEEKLKNDLAGRSRDALATILSGYPGIEQAEVSLRPFWKRSFPDKSSKIKINKILEE